MPDFTPDDIDVSPDEFINACNQREIGELIDALFEDGHIQPDRTNRNGSNGVRNPNMYDDIFWESLEQLAKCRDLLTKPEEDFINNLANKFKYLR
jgi:hypothetical protein